jgi:Arc/MetJ-type ribon-helix-helix transcriptional regulator
MASMSIRLSADDLAKIRDLRKQGVNVSELVRDAVRAEHRRRTPRRYTKREMEAIFAEIYAKYPDPPDKVKLDFDPHDRHARREAIARKIRRGRAR